MTRRFRLDEHEETTQWSLAEHLNDEQYAVATASGGPMLVVAGAGSGKTRTLTYRIAWLVEQGIDPGRILLMTFTNRAARDMLQRVELLLRQEIRRIWGGTFHHIGNRLLRMYGIRIGINPEFSILDRDDSRALIKTCTTDLKVGKGRQRFPSKNVLGAIFSLSSNTLQPLEELIAKRFPEHDEIAEEIRRVRDLYEEKKRKSNMLDFDDLLSAWLRLMQENDEIQSLLCERFEHVLVDEYQDTTALQAAIVDRMASRHRNVCVVGDDAQAIYSFRGATSENILAFQAKYPEAEVFKIETNYRSTPEILALANVNIAHNQRRLPKELRAVRPSGLKPAVVPCRNHEIQARFVTEYIRRLLAQGYRRREIAVLYRSHWHSMEIQLNFQRSNIPFEVRGGLRFFEQAHIKDVMSYLRVVHNPLDDTAWLRILPHVEGIGEKLSYRVLARIRDTDDPLAAAASEATVQSLPKRTQEGYREIAELLRMLAAKRSPARMIEQLVADFYEEYLMANYENVRSRLDDIRGTVEFAEQYDNLQALLADIALAGEYSSDELDRGQEADEEDAVVLSTIHQAKGLEWKVVFVPWLVEGRFPPGYSMQENDGEEEEERRIFHVAVTRAEDELYLIVPQTGKGRSRRSEQLKPSRFLKELASELYEPMLIESGMKPVRPFTSENPAGKLMAETCSAEPRNEGQEGDEPYYEYDEDVPTSF